MPQACPARYWPLPSQFRGRRMKFPLAIIIAGAVVFTAWATANGQESPKQTVFEPFDFWQKAQLGATSLVNPTTAEKAKVLYSYNPNHLIGKTTELESA